MFKIKKKYKILLLIIIITILTLFVIFVYHKVQQQIQINNCPKLYADKVIKLPNYNDSINNGFTGTGLFWDKNTNTFLVADAGKLKPSDFPFEAKVNIIDKNFTNIIKTIPCYKKHKKMRDIQGIAKMADGSIWISSFGEDKIYQIDEYGNDLFSFDVKEPSGLTIDNRNDSIWILTKKQLINYTKKGKIIKKIKINIPGQDQLYFDEQSNDIYISSGINYNSDSYIYIINLDNYEINPYIILKDSYAIEGISIIDNTLYVINDGYYHDAKVPHNQVNIYYLPKNIKNKK